MVARRVHLRVAAYDLGEALANLVQPFLDAAYPGLFHPRARDVLGYALIVFRPVPTVLLLVTLLGLTPSSPL
jgi:short subunit fatty acids transporter